MENDVFVEGFKPVTGKSLHIDRLEERMDNGSHGRRVVLRLYDRQINFEKVLDVLWDCRRIENPFILHFDVSPIVSSFNVFVFRSK